MVLQPPSDVGSDGSCIVRRRVAPCRSSPRRPLKGRRVGSCAGPAARPEKRCEWPSPTVGLALPETGMATLPTPVLCDILALIAAVDAKAVPLISRVCCRWRSCTRSEYFWQRICIARWPTTSQALPLVNVNGGFRNYYQKRSAAPRQNLSSSNVAAAAVAGISWMIDLLDADGTSLLTQVVTRTANEWQSTFPTIVEANVVNEACCPVPFALLSRKLAQLRVSVSVVRRSDLRTLCVVNDGRLQTPRGVPRAAEGLYKIARGTIDSTKSKPLTLRVELDGTDPALDHAVIGVMVEAGNDESSLPEFASAMLLADWA